MASSRYQPPAGVPLYWERDLAGIGVRVQRNGRRVCIVQSCGPAGQKSATLGPVAGKAIDQRRRQAAKVIDCIKRGGGDGGEPARSPPGRP